ncbi:hypothetical protein SAMN04487996_1061, partial [Dyadobacter soli]
LGIKPSAAFDVKEDLMAPNWKILNSNHRKESFGEQILPLRVILIRILLIYMHVKYSILTVDGCQFKIFKDKLW